MKKNIFFLVVLFLNTFIFGQTGIGTKTPNKNAMLEISSSDKGFLLPRLEKSVIESMTDVPAGLQVFNTTNGCLETYFGQTNGWGSMCPCGTNPGGGGGTGTGGVGGTASMSCGETLNLDNSKILYTGQTFVNSDEMIVSVPYINGDGKEYTSSLAIESTGVTGLKANLIAGTLNTGSGTVKYRITGLANTSGLATFNTSGNLGPNNSSCSFSVYAAISVDRTIPTSWVTYTQGNTSGNYVIRGETVRITGAYSGMYHEHGAAETSNNVCGITSMGNIANFIHLGYNDSTVGTGNIRIIFDKRVTNLKVFARRYNTDTTNNRTLSFTTDSGIPTITPFGGNCNLTSKFTQNTFSSAVSTDGTYINIGGLYYKELNISTNGDGWVIFIDYTTGSLALPN